MKKHLVINGVSRHDYRWCSDLNVASEITGAELKEADIFHANGQGVVPQQKFLDSMSAHGWEIVSYSESWVGSDNFHFTLIFSKEN